MPPNVYLVCLRRTDPEVMEAIREEWKPADRYEITDTQVLVTKTINGGESVHDRIEGRLGRRFPALIVRCRSYHGRHSSELWEWLDSFERR